MTPDITAEDLTAALERCAEDLLWEAGVAGPPVDAFEVAERLGLVVAEDQGLRGRARFARLQQESLPGDSGVVLLAPEPRPERRQWALAHEIGEFAAQRVFEQLGVPPAEAPPSAREAVANGVANRLLLPRRWFAAEATAAEWDLLALKPRFPTASHELIARRTLDLIHGPTVVTVMDLGAVSWRRTNFGGAAPAFLAEETACWSACHGHGQLTEAESLGPDTYRVRCWPVHEPGWKREVLLTELMEEG